MTNRSFFTKGCIKSSWKVLICLIMAFILFFECPFKSEAASLIQGDSYYSYYITGINPIFPLTCYSYASLITSTSEDYWIPVTYTGFYSEPIMVSSSAGRKFTSGYLIIPCTVAFTGNFPTFTDTSVSLVSQSVPEGVTVSLMNQKSETRSFSFDICITFQDYYYTVSPRLSITYALEANGYAKTSQVAYNANWCKATFTHGNISAQYGIFYNDLSEYGPGASWNKMIVDACKLVVGQVASTGNYIGKICQNILDNMVDYSSRIISAANTNSQNEINAANKNSQSEINASNTNSANEINAANKNSENEINTANKNADDIMHSYDSTDQSSDNQRFDESQKQLQETEDSLFSSAMSGFDGLNLGDYSFTKFTDMLQAFSFVSGFIQSLYVKMGDFGLIVTIGLVVMIATKVIGVYRFSTGGDP